MAPGQAVLTAIAYRPTASLPMLVEQDFWAQLSDADFMRIAVLLAQKSLNEGGCPIGTVIIGNGRRQIVGKGHNTLVQGKAAVVPGGDSSLSGKPSG